jgi:hypothetical protein
MRLEPVSERHRPPLRDILWHQAALPRLGAAPRHRRPARPELPADALAQAVRAGRDDSRPCAVSPVGKIRPGPDVLRPRGRRRLARRQDEIVAVSRATARDVELLLRRAGRAHHRHSQRHRPWPFPARIQSPRDRGRLRPAGLRPLLPLRGAPRAPRKEPRRADRRLQPLQVRDRVALAPRPGGRRLARRGDDPRPGARLAISRDIDFLGFVPAADLPDWYRAADVFVFPSLYEGFGLPPVEAMACACPVLSSGGRAGGDCRGAAGRWSPLDIGQIQAQLTRAAADRAWREQLAAAGLARAHNFDWRCDRGGHAWRLRAGGGPKHAISGAAGQAPVPCGTPVPAHSRDRKRQSSTSPRSFIRRANPTMIKPVEMQAPAVRNTDNELRRLKARLARASSAVPQSWVRPAPRWTPRPHHLTRPALATHRHQRVRGASGQAFDQGPRRKGRHYLELIKGSTAQASC